MCVYIYIIDPQTLGFGQLTVGILDALWTIVEDPKPCPEI